MTDVLSLPLPLVLVIIDGEGIKAAFKWPFDWMLEFSIDPKGLLGT